MEIITVEFDEKLIIEKNNQKIEVSPFQTQEQGTVKIGISAPKGIRVDREEVSILKQEKQKSEMIRDSRENNDDKKIQSLFKLLNTITCKSEKLEYASKLLFNKDKTLKPKTLEAIAEGKGIPGAWTVSCVIDILLLEKPILLNNILNEDDYFRLWARPLIRSSISHEELINKAKQINLSEVIERISTYGN